MQLPPGLGDDHDHAGWIEFGRPPRGLPEVNEDMLRLVRSDIGWLLLLASYLYHRTLAFAGTGKRSSISNDLGPLRA